MTLVNEGFAFYYPIKLHYSQTKLHKILTAGEFYYPIKLHYSQTTAANCNVLFCFTTL